MRRSGRFSVQDDDVVALLPQDLLVLHAANLDLNKSFSSAARVRAWCACDWNPQDDYLHALESASNFNESRYYNFFDPGAGMGGWVRMGNRPNEGYAEMTVCLYLPDGRVGFMFKRPQIEGHDAHDAGGLRFEVVAPYEEHHVTYDGKVCVLASPREMADPDDRVQRRTRTTSARSTSTSRRSVAAVGRRARVGRGRGAKPDLDPRRVRHAATPSSTWRSPAPCTVGDERFDITDALGLRDHSWGPRVWQSIWWYRWVTVSFGGRPRLRVHRRRHRGRSRPAQRQRLGVRRRPLRRRPRG